eukprot:5292873-Amphidinium_carterae.2
MVGSQILSGAGELSFWPPLRPGAICSSPVPPPQSPPHPSTRAARRSPLPVFESHRANSAPQWELASELEPDGGTRTKAIRRASSGAHHPTRARGLSAVPQGQQAGGGTHQEGDDRRAQSTFDFIGAGPPDSIYSSPQRQARRRGGG